VVSVVRTTTIESLDAGAARHASPEQRTTKQRRASCAKTTGIPLGA
jgi:hypothetical protein